ncbi:MAG: hypothetical protein AAFW60_11050 [Pseudomonadota bacterium]
MALAVLISLGAPNQQFAYAATTTADFLKWERSAQDSFFQISITMAATIAAQHRPQIAKCLEDWYFRNSELQDQRHDEILNQMPELTSYRPASVVLAFLEAACGKLD